MKKRNDELRFVLAEEATCEDTSNVCCHEDDTIPEENLCENHSDIGYR